jgi:hypothetical protein
VLPTPHARPISRSERLSAHRSRRISVVLRKDCRAPGLPPASSRFGFGAAIGRYPASRRPIRLRQPCSASLGIDVRLPSDSVFAIDRNGCSGSIGICSLGGAPGVRDGLVSVAESTRAPKSLVVGREEPRRKDDGLDEPSNQTVGAYPLRAPLQGSDPSRYHVAAVHPHLRPKRLGLGHERSHILVNLRGGGGRHDVRLHGRTQLHELVQAAAEVIVPGK